jgi:hypothetical protein
MQTIQLQVKDGYTQNILDMLGSVKDIMLEKIELKQDPNLEYDTYFYERKVELDKTIEAVDNGSMKMYDSQEWENEMLDLDKEIEAVNAN